MSKTEVSSACPSGDGVKHYLRAPERRIALISLAHGVNDMYAAYLPTFIPFIRENLGLSYALAGSMNLIVGIFHLICQPVIGYVCDRIRRPVLMIIGPILCGLGAAMLPNTNSFALTIAFAGLWGLGSALYHPQGNGGIGYISPPGRLPTALAWFNIVGTVGTMLSPVIAVGSVRLFGYKGLLFTLIPALLLAPLLAYSMPFLREESTQAQHAKKGFFRTFGAVFAVLYPILAIAITRDTIFQFVRFLLPLKVVAEGGSLEDSGGIVFFLTLGSILGMIPATKIAKKIGDTKTMLLSVILCFCFFMAANALEGWPSIACYFMVALSIYSNSPIAASMAQKIVPGERSMSSAVVVGLSWGMSNVLLSPCGKLIDIFGIYNTLVIVGFLPLLSLPFFMTKVFREHDRHDVK
ncbi:MFS transporter [Synergistales bacterium]|nr:MFS transporter [Synergistales bacterium]